MIEVNWNPSSRTLRQFAAVSFVFFGAIATVSWFRGGSWRVQAISLAVAITAGTVGLIRPHALRLPFVLLTYAVYPIGFTISHLILMIVFYGVITPLGVIARLMEPDPLQLRGDEKQSSYWIARRRARDKASYLRQA